jgi:hypothetical protein
MSSYDTLMLGHSCLDDTSVVERNIEENIATIRVDHCTGSRAASIFSPETFSAFGQRWFANPGIINGEKWPKSTIPRLMRNEQYF